MFTCIGSLYIRHDGRPVKAFLLFFLIFLRRSISFPLVVLLPSELPAPAEQSPAAAAHLSSCCRNELCSRLERDLVHRNLWPLFLLCLSYHTTSWDTGQAKPIAVLCSPAVTPLKLTLHGVDVGQ